MTGTEQDTLADRFAQVVRVLGAERSPQLVLERTVQLATQVIDGAEHASVTLPRNGQELETRAATSAVARAADAIEYEVDAGPCVTALRDSDVVLVDDLAGEARWPAFSSRAVEATGVRSVLSLPLFTGHSALGSLNLYAQQPRSFSPPSRAAGVMLAAQAALALHAAQQQEHVAQLQERAQHAEDLLAEIGHDLRSRMTSMAASAELLLGRRAQLGARGEEALELLAGELGRQQRMLLDVFDLARAHREGSRGSARTPLLPVVREVLLGHPRPIPLDGERRAENLTVPARAEMLARILRNLLDDADIHGGGPTRVEIGQRPGVAWVAVEDAGPGVPQPDQAGNFQRVTATATTGARSRTPGLGLALAREHARLLGGDLTVEDRVGGARFTMSLPLVTPDSSD